MGEGNHTERELRASSFEVKELSEDWFQISGENEALIELALSLYQTLGGSETDGAREVLESGRELRPRSGIFAISVRKGKLHALNSNMKGHSEMNRLLKEAIEKEIG